MPFVDAQPQAGTQKSPQQTKISQPCFTDTDHVHFPDGRLTTLPPYAVASALNDYVTLLGGARFIHGQKRDGTFAGTWFVIGTSTRLYALKNSNLYNITPFADQKAESLGADPIAVHSGDATVTITWVAHGLSVGDAITLSGATTVDGFTANDLNIEHTVATTPTADTFTIEMGTTASSTTTGGGASVTASSIGLGATLGANPISTTNLDATVTVAYTAHGLAVGDRIKLRDATATGGIAAAQLNIEHIVATVPTDDTFTIEVAPATSTTTGGGSAVRIYKPIAAGNLNQDAATGYGAGLFGEGVLGVGGESQGAQTYPRIWSGAQFGNDMVLCAGDYLAGDGQKIYFWDCDTSKAPTVLANAPTNCNWVTVVNNAVVALCGTQVRVCEVGNATVWSGLTTFTSRELSVWKLISGTAYTEKDGVIYAPNKAFLLSYTGDEYLWDLREIFNEDGILAPNAYAIVDAKIYWRGFRGTYIFDGAPPRLIENGQNDDWIIQNTNYAQVWKCFSYDVAPAFIDGKCELQDVPDTAPLIEALEKARIALAKLTAFQELYSRNTGNFMPGNEFYS